MTKIVVLMSTYNGEKYLFQQINSILNQKNVDVHILIRDDGSTDSTDAILKKIARTNSNISVKVGANKGASLSFMQLLAETKIEADYYAFADQDDIWMPEKLDHAVAILEEKGPYDLYASNQTVVDADNIVLSKRYDFIPPTDILNIIDKNYLSGCTMVMKRDLFSEVKEYKPDPELIKNRMHDTWVAAVSACLGQVVYDQNSYIHYRQHENNVVGVKNIELKTKIRTKFLNRNKNYHKKFADELFRLFNRKMTAEAREVIRLYQNCDTFHGKVELLLSEQFHKTYFRNKNQFALKLFAFE